MEPMDNQIRRFSVATILKTVALIDLVVTLSFALFVVETIIFSAFKNRNSTTHLCLLLAVFIFSALLLFHFPIALFEIAFSDPEQTQDWSKNLLDSWVFVHLVVVPCAMFCAILWVVQEYQDLAGSMTCALYVFFRMVALCIVMRYCQGDLTTTRNQDQQD